MLAHRDAVQCAATGIVRARTWNVLRVMVVSSRVRPEEHASCTTTTSNYDFGNMVQSGRAG